MATFKELTGSTEADKITRPLDTLHRSGADTRRAEGEREKKLAEETTVLSTARAAWERNITPMFVDEVQRKWSHEPEEGFDPSAWVTENSETLPGVNLEEFQTVRSTGEAEELRGDMLRAKDNDALLAAKGVTGVVAQVLSGVVDPAEIAVGVVTAGTGKVATMAARAGRMVAAGAVGGGVSGSIANAVDPLADSVNVVVAGLSGAVLSTGLSASAAPFNKAIKGVRENYRTYLEDEDGGVGWFSGPDKSDAPAFEVKDPAEPSEDTPADMSDLSPRSATILEQAQAIMRDNNLGARRDATDLNTDTNVGRAAVAFSNLLATKLYTGLKTDYDRLMYGGSDIEAALAFNFLESAEGRLRHNRTAAMLQNTYEGRLSDIALPQLEYGYSAWSKARNIGIIDKMRPASRTAFNREVIHELEARWHEGKAVSPDASIRATADAIDRSYKEALDIARGRDGETAVSGFEDIKAQSGFFNHKWSGSGLRQAMKKGHSKQSIENLLVKGYAKAYPQMEPAQRTMIAKAVMRRSLAKEDGIDTNMLSTLDSDGQEYLRELLIDSGYDELAITSLLDSLRGKSEKRGQLGTTKQRVQVDLRTNENGLSLMDLVDTNLIRVMSAYNRDITGQAALARKGIQNRGQRKQMIDAAMAERRARNLPTDPAQRKFLEDIFTYFDTGPIGGGVDPIVSRMKQLTNLALLNQMGVTQAGEAGAQIAAVGMDVWKHHAKAVYKEMSTQGPQGHIASELRPIMGTLGNEHMFSRQDLMMDELSNTAELNTWLGKLDFALGKGQRIQGFASGFYHVKAFQQKVATISMADKIMQRLRDGTDVEALEALSLPKAIKKYVAKGYVEFDADGYTTKLNLDKWAIKDVDDFALVLNRHTHRVVQKALAGEESMWMHRTVGSMYMHLKSFPMLAMRKQSARLAGGQTPEAVAALLMGLATAGLAYEAKQLINGRTERINGTDALKGAIGMSNMSGWVPMLTDPVAQILGMRDLRMNQYGRHDINTGILATPPSIPTLNRLAQVPGAVNPLGDLSPNERIRILQTLPLVGNLYGFSGILNRMKE